MSQTRLPRARSMPAGELPADERDAARACARLCQAARREPEAVLGVVAYWLTADRSGEHAHVDR